MAGSMRETTRHGSSFTAWAPERTRREREYYHAIILWIYCLCDAKREEEKEEKKAVAASSAVGTHLSVPTFFMIVSLPEDAAFTICCSTDLFILALSA